MEYYSTKLLRLYYYEILIILMKYKYEILLRESIKQLIITFDSPSLLAITPRILETGISSYVEGRPLGTCAFEASPGSFLPFSSLGAAAI